MKNLFHLSAALFLGLLLASCGRADRMRTLLEQAEWMNQHDSLFTSDSIGKALVSYYDHWWHPADLRLRAYYMLGCAYRDMGNAPRALENYQLATAQVDTLTAPDSTLNRLMRVYSQMAHIFLLQRLPEQEEEVLHTAERLAWQIGDTLSALTFESHLCTILYNKKEYNKCIKQAIQLRTKFLLNGYEEDSKVINVHCVKSYLALKDYNQVKHYLNQYEGCSYFRTNPKRIIGELGILYIYKGQYFIGINQPDSAEYYFHKAQLFQDVWNNYLLITKGLCDVYELKHNVDSLAKYVNLYSEAKEKSFDEAQTTATIQAKSLYDYTIEQQQAKKQAEKSSQLSKLLMVAIMLILALVLLLLYYRRKKKRRITYLIQRYQTAVQELHEAEEDLNAQSLKHTNDKNLIARHEDNIRSLKEQVRFLTQSIRKIESRVNSIRIEEADITKNLMASRMIGKTMTREEWMTICKLVEENHPTFYEHMNARQKLNESEYMVCVLTVSGFNPTDIEILMGKSNSFSAMTRKRLCVKVFGIEGKPQDFDRLIHQSY